MLSASSAPNARVIPISHGVSTANTIALDCNMDATVERECTALGSLFQQIIQDMKVYTFSF